MLEYPAPNDDLWRIEDLTLLAEFDLPVPDHPDCAAHLTAWHARMAGLGQPWAVVQRYFGVWPVLGAGADARQWMCDEIRDDLGISQTGIEDAVTEAAHFWKLVSGQIGRPVPAPPPGDPAVPVIIEPGGAPKQTRGYNRSEATARDLPLDEIDRLLISNDLDGIVDDDSRRLAASRLIDLDNLLADEASRPMVIMAIRQELDIRWLNHHIDTSRDNPSEVSKVRGLIKERDNAQQSYDATMKSLGATQSQKSGAHRRAAMQDCLGMITQGIQDYYAKGDASIVDGMNTEFEIRFELDPVAERESQYDPVTALNAWFATLALFDKDYDCPLPKSGVKRLRKIFGAAKAEFEAEHEIEPRRLDDPAASFAGGEADEDELAAQDSALAGEAEATQSLGAAPAPATPRALPPGFGPRGPSADLVCCG